jgi:predicted permease
MALEINLLLRLYIPLVAWICLGLVLGRSLPKSIPERLGHFLFWVGVPFSIMVFLRSAHLSGAVWLAPAIAWAAQLTGALLAWIWSQGQLYLRWLSDRYPSLPRLRPLIQLQNSSEWSKPTQGSFLLASMVGNTGYLGYPVTLAVVGPQYFAWAVFYDTLGSTLGAYGLGVAIAARFGMSTQTFGQLIRVVLCTPALWSFAIGLELRQVPLPTPVEQGLKGVAWSVIALSLLLLGMRLSQLSSWQSIRKAGVSLAIKMAIVPLILGLGLAHFGITGPPLLVIVLQMGMPPAFATLVIAEAYNLDRTLTVTTLALGSVLLLVMLPLWIALFQ